mgnify:CR=1 FL=1
MPDIHRNVLVANCLVASRPAQDTKRPTPRKPEHGVITRSCKHMLCDQKIADMPVLRQLNVMESDVDSSDGETLHTETESEESDVETQSDLDFIDDSSTDFIDTPSTLHYLSDIEDLRYNSYQTYQHRNTILLKSKHVR